MKDKITIYITNILARFLDDKNKITSKKQKMMDPRLFYLSLFLAFALAMFSNYLFSIFGIVLIADTVRKCPCCDQPINSKDYGKKVWERSNASE